MSTPNVSAPIMSTPIPDCLKQAAIVSLEPGVKIFEAGDRCENFYFLLDGQVRVDLVTESGKSMTLYRFGAGETCILTTSCLISGDLYNAEAITETTVSACAMPINAFKTQMDASPEFRELVFASLAIRLASMMTKIEEVAFTSVDHRLAMRLLELGDQNQTIEVTHEQLASDLGTAREVISRKLAVWEKKSWIKRNRGSLVILDGPQLEQLAGAS